MYCEEGVRSNVRSKGAGYLLFDLQFPYPPFAAVVGGYQRIFEEVEDVVPDFYESLPQSFEVILQMRQILCKQFAQSVKPRSLADNLFRSDIPLMDSLTQ